ncbi:MAG TPA: penicillin-binding protein 2 [Solirubrobacteraceae bacterium]|nr:penicillin-binding protein 2 [Solirubrobacteraceae bacterium]
MAAIDRRVGWLFLAFAGLLTIALLRAVDLGVLQGPSLQRDAATQQVTNVPVPAARGTITDSTGVELAISEAADNVIADPYLIKDPQRVAAQLSPLLGKPELSLLPLLTEAHRGWVVLALQIPGDLANEITNMRIDGISMDPTVRRVYPRSTLAAQVLGTVGGYDQGLSGLELEYNHALAGVAGQRRVVSDAIGQPISIDAVKATVPGQSLRLTINAALQTEVQQVLAGVGAQYSPKAATAIVMNPDTGAILALASWPTVNANDPPPPSNSNNSDMAVQFNYEPGSTFKAITVSGALQEGLITPNTEFTIPPYLEAYGQEIQDAEAHGYEQLTTAGILKVSSNIGADLIGQRLGPTQFNYWVHRFGFGSPTGVDLPGEDSGIILSPSLYSGTSMYNLPFGQGESVTPMQMATAYAAIANGGILRPPHIVSQIGNHTLPLPKGHRIISATTAAELRQMLRGVLGEGGTASGAAIQGYDMAGKTGTAQVVVNGKYSATEFDSSFIGMVPANDPKLLVAVVAHDTEQYGAGIAAPAFQKIVGWAVPYFGIDPR